MVETCLRGVVEIVHQGQEEGVVRADREAQGVAVAFLGVIQPAAIPWQR